MSLVVKRFTAEWCSPCSQLGPIMESVSSQFNDVAFDVIDIDDSHEVAKEFGVRSIPCVVLIKDGTEVSRFIGVRPENFIVSLINDSK